MSQGEDMACTTQIIYQPYVAGPRGSLKAGKAVACRTPEDGLRRAERALHSGSILGAQVVRRVVAWTRPVAPGTGLS